MSIREIECVKHIREFLTIHGNLFEFAFVRKLLCFILEYGNVTSRRVKLGHDRILILTRQFQRIRITIEFRTLRVDKLLFALFNEIIRLRAHDVEFSHAIVKFLENCILVCLVQIECLYVIRK